MADIGINGVTYARVEGSQKAGPSDPRYQAVYNVSFGDGVDTYPAGGIPLVKGRLGCPTVLDEFIIMDMEAADGILYKFDSSTDTIRAYQTAEVVDTDPAAELVELEGGTAVVAATTLKVKVSGW